MSLVIGDDSPEAAEPPDQGKQASMWKRRDWSPWRGRRPQSMLIQDAPDPAEYGAEYDYDDEEDYGDGYEAGPPYPGNGFFLAAGPAPDRYARDVYQQDDYPDDGYPADRIGGDRIDGDRYPESGYADFPGSGPATFIYGDPGHADAGHDDPDYAGAGYRGPGHPDSGYPDSGYPGSWPSGSWPSGHAPAAASDRGRWYEAERDGFRAPPDEDDYRWDDGDGPPVPDAEGPARRSLRSRVPFLRRQSGDRDEDGPRTFVSSAQRLGGLLLAAASVIGAGLYVPSILAADSHSFTGVVSSNGIASLNFRASGRVGTVRVHLGQAVRQGEVLATEAGAAMTAALRADRAAIAADKANLSQLRADGSAATSIRAAQARLRKDRIRRRSKQAAAEIVAPRDGTVVAINGEPGETVSRAGLSRSAVDAQASPKHQQRFSLLPSGPVASLPAAGRAVPVIALRTGGGWQVRLLIPQTDTSAVKAGGQVTISVPAAQLSGVKGTIAELSPLPVSNSGGAAYEAVVQVPGRTRVTPLSGMTVNVQLGSLRLRGRAAPAQSR